MLERMFSGERERERDEVRREAFSPDMTLVVGDRLHVRLDVAPVALVLMLLLGPDEAGVRIPLHLLTHQVKGKRTQL